MAQEQNQAPPLQAPTGSVAHPPAEQAELSLPSPLQPLSFDPSRMIGIIKRKALIKELAAAYHTECLAYSQELLELQKKWEEPFVDLKTPVDSRKETGRSSKRTKRPR